MVWVAVVITTVALAEALMKFALPDWVAVSAQVPIPTIVS